MFILSNTAIFYLRELLFSFLWNLLIIEVVEPSQVDVLKASLSATSLHFPAIVSSYNDDLLEFNVLPGQRALTLGVAKTASYTNKLIWCLWHMLRLCNLMNNEFLAFLVIFLKILQYKSYQIYVRYPSFHPNYVT